MWLPATWRFMGSCKQGYSYANCTYSPFWALLTTHISEHEPPGTWRFMGTYNPYSKSTYKVHGYL